MTRRQAALFAAGITTLFGLVFAGMTIQSHTAFPRLTNSDRLTPDVRAGQALWHRGNCVNCHTLLGEGAYYAPDLTKIAQQRGAAYLDQFLADPARFYSEAEHGRLMTNPQLSQRERAQLIAFLDWISRIENQKWPPRPILVSGSAVPGGGGTTRPTEAASTDPVALGETLFRSTPPGCFACHSTQPGVTLAGPSLSGIATRAAATIATPGYTGAAKTAEEYIRESIVQPSAYVVPGATFSAGGRSFMPDNFGTTLKQEQVNQLVAYLATQR